MNKKGLFAIAVILALVIIGIAYKTTSPYASAITHTEKLYKASVAAPDVPSLAVAVGHKGDVIWEAAFGFADLETGAPATPRSLYRIASISKVITTAALGRMIERNEIDLDVDVRTYVPSFPEKQWPVTIRQLAAHLGGIRTYEGDEMLISRPYASALEGLDVFKESPLMWEPGSQYKYSTFGWNLISAAMAGAANKPFLDIVQDDVITPLGLDETFADKNRDLIKNRVSFYTVGEDGIGNAPYVDNSYKWAGGGYLMSMADTVKFAMAHDHAGYLKAETLDEFLTPMRLNDGTPSPHGVGWFIGFGRYLDAIDQLEESERTETINRAAEIMRAHNDHTVFHSGGAVGDISMMILDRQHDIAVAVSRNASGDLSAQSQSPANLAILTLGAFADAIAAQN